MPPLSKQQAALVEATDNTFAEACPGAGKTRAIVARFRRRVMEEPRKGIALVSFTNGAIEEVRKRSGEWPDALRAPNFVGTFDGFINRFVTKPLYVQQYGKAPRFSETWAGLALANFGLSGLDRKTRFQLDWFELDWRLRATLRDEWLPYRSQWVLPSLTSTLRADLEEEATRRCRSLVSAGTISCAASRALAAHYLKRVDNRELFGTLLAARFSEVIVDEAQDCGPAELSILELLKECGVRVIAVADLDQSIFEFRRAEPAGVLALANSLPTHLTLDGNWRSSPAICAVNNSLRQGEREECPEGSNKDYRACVQLVGFDKPQEVTAAVEVILKDHELAVGDIIFLAHRGSDARSCAGGASQRASQSDNRVLSLAWACSVLRSVQSGGRDRRKAIELVERTLRLVVDVGDDDLRINDRWLRDTAMRLALTLDPAAGAKDFTASLRQSVQAIQWPDHVALVGNPNQRFKTPDDKDWPASDDAQAFRSGTIHSVKGQEFPGVVVVLPKNLREDADGHVLDHWESRVSTEAKRVLYVGASRAQRLLIFASHTSHVDRIAALLAADGVPHVRA